MEMNTPYQTNSSHNEVLGSPIRSIAKSLTFSQQFFLKCNVSVVSNFLFCISKGQEPTFSTLCYFELL